MVEARTPASDDLAEDLEMPWTAFLGWVMGETVDNCRWLARASRNKSACLQATASGNFGKRLVCSSVSWNWVFSGPECALTFRSVCDELGLNEDYVRERILSECDNARDINQVVRYAFEVVIPTCRSGFDGHDDICVDWSALEKPSGKSRRGV